MIQCTRNMETTTKLQRKSSLSLSTRLSKRHSASPKNLPRIPSTSNAPNASPKSPSLTSVYSDGGIECTPPQKKKSTNDDSPRQCSPVPFDCSFSPSCFLSQTLGIDSPEVGWEWKHHGDKGQTSTRTPDSAYAADSSFTSAGSSSTEILTNARARFAMFNSRLSRDALREQEQRRVEMSKADRIMKERCAKLREQLNSAGTQRSNDSPQTIKDNSFLPSSMSSSTQNSTETVKAAACPDKETPSIPPIPADSFNDFFNDSDSDVFLLAATQQIESQLDTQLSLKSPTLANTDTGSAEEQSEIAAKENYKSIDADMKEPENTCTPLSKHKRPSFYMQFLEDDCTDDWFASLDEVVLQATQSKKPRTSLQRYKSMPTKSDETKMCLSPTRKSDSTLNESTDSHLDTSTTSTSSTAHARMKRHSSSHALSPINGHHRNRLKK